MTKINATLGILLCLALAFPYEKASASESFTLNVPVRFNANQETGEVRITLGLNAAPAGAQLVVNGTTTLNLGDTTLVGTDSVAFAAGTTVDEVGRRLGYADASAFTHAFTRWTGTTPGRFARSHR